VVEKKVIIFTLGGEKYGVDVEQVLSIEKMTTLTRIPNTENFIKGIINIRGIIYPVIDLLERFRIGTSIINEETRLCLVQLDEMKVAFIVDGAEDVASIDTEKIEQAPHLVGGVHAEYINGIAKLETGILILLNLERVLRDDHIEKIKQIEGA